MTGLPIHRIPLYGLACSDQLAHGDVLGFSPEQLSDLAGDDKAYHAFTRITSGKKRAVTEPLGDLLKVHDRLFTLLDRIEKPDYLHSGVKGRSHVTNARVHLGDEPTVALDIRQFFPSIDVPRVYRFFRRQLACAAPVAELLTRLCTFRGHVPIGSRMSQHLAYFAAKPMLDDLHGLSVRHGVLFSCYVDDLSFSGRAAMPSFLWRVKQVVHHHRFSYHNGHCYGPGECKTITGVIVARDRLAVPRHQVEQMQRDEAAIDKLLSADQPKALDRLIGCMAAAASIDPRFRETMKQLVARRATLRPRPESECGVLAPPVRTDES